MRRLLLVALLTSATSTAYAEGIFESNFYVGVGAGLNQYFQDWKEPNYFQSNSGSTMSATLFAGWHMDYFAGLYGEMEVKGRFTNYTYTMGQGLADAYDAQTSKSSIGLFSHTGFQVRNNWSLYSITGLNYNFFEIEDKSNGNTAEDDYLSFEFGLGSNYRLNENWSLRLEATYDYGFGDALNNGFVNIEQNAVNVDFGVKYSF